MCIIGHDSTIGNRVKIMNNCKLNGFVDIGSDTFIGTGTTIRNRINIGFNCYVGQNSNVVSDIPDNSFGYGNPFKVIRKNNGIFRLTFRKFMDMIQ
jgi:UDP-3-O-[3-hydroxymyristoyl] glucosamine N-acyltransferase